MKVLIYALKKPDKNDADSGGEDAEDNITADMLKELGGDQEDLDLVQSDSKAEKPLDKQGEKELRDLIASLNFKKFAPEKFDVKKEDKDDESSVVKDKAKKGEEGSKGEIQDSTINSTTPDLSDSEQKEEKSFFHFVKSVPSRTHCVVKNQVSRVL